MSGQTVSDMIERTKQWLIEAETFFPAREQAGLAERRVPISLQMVRELMAEIEHQRAMNKTWTGVAERVIFELTHLEREIGSLRSQKGSFGFTFIGIPSDGDTITVNGKTFRFVLVEDKNHE